MLRCTILHPFSDPAKLVRGAMANFLIVGDLPISADALERCVCDLFHDASFTRSSCFEDASRMLRSEQKLDLVIFDMWLPSLDELNEVVRLRRISTMLPFLVVSSFIDRSLLRAAKHQQVTSLLSKTEGRDRLSQTINALLMYRDCVAETQGSEDVNLKPMMHGLSLLSRHERLVLKFIVHGLINKQIAHRLSIQESTVKAHIRNIFRKLQVHSRVEALLEVSMLNLSGLLPEANIYEEGVLEQSIGTRSN